MLYIDIPLVKHLYFLKQQSRQHKLQEQLRRLPEEEGLQGDLDRLAPGIGLKSFTSPASISPGECTSCPLLKDDDAIKFECSDMPTLPYENPSKPIKTDLSSKRIPVFTYMKKNYYMYNRGKNRIEN